MPSYHHGNLRDTLLEEAISVIGAHGVEVLSLRQLAKQVGVSHAAPTRHFKSKADLLAAIVKNGYRDLTQSVAVVLAKDERLTSVQRLNVIVCEAINWAIANPARFSVMTNPDVSRFADEEVHSLLRDFIGSVEAALKDAQKDGFRSDASTSTLLVYGVGAAMGCANALTDDLTRKTLGVKKSRALAAALADQIVPLD